MNDKALDSLPWQPPAYPEVVTLKRGVINTHSHLRDTDEEEDGRSELIVPNVTRFYTDAIAIGNTMTPLTTHELGAHKKTQWEALIPPGNTGRLHVAGLITEATDPQNVLDGYRRGRFAAMKMFLRAVSNAGGADVDQILQVIPTIKAMTYETWKVPKKPMMLKIHCERKFTLLGRRIMVADRERIAVERDLELILSLVPEAHVEICHVSDGSTIEAIRYYRKKGFNVYGEISPHYTQYTSDDLFEDGKGGTGLNNHLFCLPVFKSPKDRQIILDAMVSGEPWFYFGNDEACHVDAPHKTKGAKIMRNGIAVGGQTQIPEAIISYVIEQFAERGRLEHLQGFLSDNARAAYHLPPCENPATYLYQDTGWEVPEKIARFSTKLGHIECKVAMGGQTRLYKLAA